jgi:NitT/TauT family transport system substrate-binding protein
MKTSRIAVLTGVLLISSLVVGGCTGSDSPKGGAQSERKTATKVRVAYYGGTCEAPIYQAKSKAIFESNGLDAELVKVDFDTLKEGLATGKIDAVQVTAGELKAIEQGLDIKVTRGVHTGCIQAVAPSGSSVKGVGDLDGKTIGVEAIGGVPMTLLSIELGRAGVDFKSGVQWKAYPAPQLAQALKKGEIDAFITWDPFGQQAIDSGTAKRIFSNTYDAPYKDQFCCFVGVNGRLLSEDPKIAAAITASLAEAAEQIERDALSTAKMAIDEKYTAGDTTTTAFLLGEYGFDLSGDKTRDSLGFWLTNMKEQGVLDPATDPKTLLESVYAPQP